MNTEEKIVETIERLNASIEHQTAWLKVEEDDPLLPVLEDMRDWAKAIFFVLVLVASLLISIAAKATPLLPPLEETAFAEIGEPPAPPPNPNVQYWYTMEVPGPQGVLPQEVFAPRLVAQAASETQGVETPEPTTGSMVAYAALALLIAYLGLRGRTWCVCGAPEMSKGATARRRK